MNDTPDDSASANPLERVPTGVPGLDVVMQGGFFRGGVYMFLARPGAGKTILGNQICFRHVAAGGRALIVTLLTESHSRLIAQLQNFSFYEPTCVGSTLSYVAGYQVLEKDKLKGLLVLLRTIVREHRATLLLIDGLVTVGSLADSELETKKFIHELQVFAELVGCTTLLLTGQTKLGEHYAMQTMVEGLIELHVDRVGVETVRELEVSKFRGSRILMGKHRFEIASAGITVYPRTESLRGRAIDRPDPSVARLGAFAIQGLDAMLGGGLRSGSVTLLLGTPGSGKTLLGLSFLVAGAKRGEPGLYFGFFEAPTVLSRKAEAIGLGLAAQVTRGLVEMMWQSPLDAIADALAENLLEAVRKQKVRRLFVDGLGGFRETLVHAERSRRFFGALCNELRSMGVATVLSDETGSLTVSPVPEHGLTAELDTVIFLRHVERRAQLHKLVAVTKMREGAGDRSVREFSIGASGFAVSGASEGAQGTLAELTRGAARQARIPPAKKARKKRRGPSAR
jgi:circadian clock protein KaiC